MEVDESSTVLDVEPEPAEGADRDALAATAAERTLRSATGKLLITIAIAAFGLRLLMIFAVHPMCPYDANRWDDPSLYLPGAQQQAVADPSSSCVSLRGDSAYLYLQGRTVADGHGLSDPVLYIVTKVELPSARKPPGVVLLVAGLAKLGLTSPDASRVALAAMGAITVLLLGQLAWRLFGRRVAMVTAVWAAVHPVLVTNDWRLLTESWGALFFVAAIAAMYRVWERPSTRAAVWSGVFFGLATYGRIEMPLLALFIFVPVIMLGLRHLALSIRLRLLFVLMLAGAAVLAPLVISNTVRFDHPTSPLGPGSGWGMQNSSCDEAWYGDLTGYLSANCFDVSTLLGVYNAVGMQYDTGKDESDADVVYREHAMQYVKDNIARFPAVASARVGRVFGFYAPAHTISLEQTIEERGTVDSVLAYLNFYVSIPLAIIGGVVMWRRRLPMSPVLAPFVAVVLISAISFGLPRYRVFADIALLLMASVGLVCLPALWRQRKGPKSGGDGSAKAWWAPRSAENAPSAAIQRAMDRAPERHLHVNRVAAAALVVVGLVLVATVGLSAAVEPQRKVAGIDDEQTRVQLCSHLTTFNDLLSQLGHDAPGVIAKLPPELDALDRLGSPAIKDDVVTIRRSLDKLTGATTGGTPPSANDPDLVAAREAAARLIDVRLKSCGSG